MREPIVTVIASVLRDAHVQWNSAAASPAAKTAHKQEETLTQVAMDGKTMRGTLGHESVGQPKVASALPRIACHSGIVLTRASGPEQRT